MDLIEQLLEFYYKYDMFQGDKMSPSDAANYFTIAINKKRILSVMDDSDNLLGYVEHWRLNYEQLGRVICKLSFNIKNEEIEYGPVVYVANLTIHPEFRKAGVMERLKKLFIIENKDAEFIIGNRSKSHSPIRIFNRSDFINFVIQ